MRSYGSLLALMVVIGVAACAPKTETVSPEQRLAMIPTGEPLLSCRADCLDAWRAAEPQAEALAESRHWSDLALLVLRVDYEDDLTVYYLAEAAQGMGYRTAAASYYRQSIELSQGPAACAVYSKMCGGIALPRAASGRLAALGRPASRRRPSPDERAAPKTEEPVAAPAASNLEQLPPAPPMTIRPPSQEEQQFIEPPPARP